MTTLHKYEKLWEFIQTEQYFGFEIYMNIYIEREKFGAQFTMQQHQTAVIKTS